MRHPPLRAWGAALLALTLTLALGGCATSEEGKGELYISLTDDPGDFVTYTVAVSALTLTRRDGAVVETLAEPVTVDFSQYVELSELLTAATVPSGVYTRATLALDYRNADIRVEGDDGATVPVTRILDADGEPIDTLTVSVRLKGRNQLTIAPGVPAHLSLDFDLAASNTPSSDYATLTVEPFLVAELQPEAPKPQRLRGALDSVNEDADRFTLLLRPFHRPLGRGLGRFGRVPVEVGDATRYEIDGASYTGADGLAALADKPRLTTPVVALGELKFDPVRYVATEVLAGSSVPGADQDVVRGHVIARSGDTVTLKGARLVRAQGDAVVFNDTVTVDLAQVTTVTRQGQACDPASAPCDTGAISVGQRLIAYGDWDETTTTLSANRLRLLVTTARGVVTEPTGTDDWMVMDLQGFDRRQVGLFDFTGSGSDPAAYRVDTGDLTTPAAGSAVKVRGFVQPFGAAPPDFHALTLVDLSAVSARYLAQWDPAATGALTATDTGLVVDDDSATRAGYRQRGVFTDLGGDGRATTLAPSEDGDGVFLIKAAGTVTLHTTYAGFQADLAARLENGAAVRAVSAKGQVDGTATLTVRRLAVSLE